LTRTKLCDRILPSYTKGEEIMNMTTHILGGAFGIVALFLCLWKATARHSALAILCACIYGAAMITVYTISSIYHGLRPGTAKKVLQVIDHCMIYLLIAGTYTPIALCAIAPVYPGIGWGLLIFQWLLAGIAATLTAIDLKKYRVFSMLCYIGMGWSALPFLAQIISVLGTAGFAFLLSGGISYTVGAVTFGFGKRIRWMHSVFHIFVVLGSLLHLITVACYVL